MQNKCNRNLLLSSTYTFVIVVLSHIMLKSLSCEQTTDTSNSKRRFNKHAIYFILLAFLPLSGEKKSSWGITWGRALHVLHSKRLRRDYPRPDVSLSKEKNMPSAKKQPYPAAGKRQAAGRRRLAVWSIMPAVSEYARFQV